MYINSHVDIIVNFLRKPAHLFHFNQEFAWFLEITFVYLSVCVCVHVRVCAWSALKALITSSVM